VLPIFKMIFHRGGVDRDEMLRVFNMGVGMVLIVAPDRVGDVAAHFAQIGQKYFFIGNVVKGSGKVVYDVPPAGFASWIE
jgi:phosphoribosylformylglycinamidine cyclo-ligase